VDSTLVGRKLAIMSGIADVLSRLPPSVRVMLREVDGVLFAGDADSTWSRSIGVEAMESPSFVTLSK